jgi:hypothetical protein
MVIISLIVGLFLIIYLTAKVITMRMKLEQIIIAVNDGFKEPIGETGLTILFGVFIGAFLAGAGP